MKLAPRASAALGVGAALAGAALRQERRDHARRVGEVREAGTDDTIRAYVAYPERKDKAPAVIVIHEVFGLTEWEPTVVDRLAKNGFVAIVPDLLSSKHGRSPADADSGRKLVGELEPDRVTADLDATYAWLGAQPAVAGDRIGGDRLLLGRRPELPLRDEQPEAPRGGGLLRPDPRRGRSSGSRPRCSVSMARTTRGSTSRSRRPMPR